MSTHTEKARIAAAAVKAYRQAGLTPDVRAQIKHLREDLRAASADLGRAINPAGMRPANVLPDLREIADSIALLADRIYEIVSTVEDARGKEN